MKKAFALVIVSVPLLAASARGQGQEQAWTLDLGRFNPSFESQARLDSEMLGTGTPISLEDDLGLDTDLSAFRLEGKVKVSPRNALRFGYVGWTRDAKVTVAQRIQWGDQVYDVDAFVDSTQKAQVGKLAWCFSLVHNNAVDFGASLGVNATEYLLRISAQDNVGGVPSGEVRVEEKDVTAPVPVIGLFLGLALAPWLALRASTEYFNAAVGDWDGEVRDDVVAVDAMLSRGLGLGVAFNRAHTTLERSGSEALFVDLRFDGLFTYLHFRF